MSATVVTTDCPTMRRLQIDRVTLRRDELVAEATAIYSAAPGSAVIADMMADFAMMIAARVAVRMTPPPEAATLRAELAAATAREVRLREALQSVQTAMAIYIDVANQVGVNDADGFYLGHAMDVEKQARNALKDSAP